MSKVAITKSKLDALAAKIATKSGATLPLTLDEMGDAVDDISGGGDSKLAGLLIDGVGGEWSYDFLKFVDTSLSGRPAGTSEYAFPTDLSEQTDVALNVIVWGQGFSRIIDENVTWNGTDIVLTATDVSVTIEATKATIVTTRSDLSAFSVYATNYDGIGYVIVLNMQPSLQIKSNIAPTESSQTITADSGFDGLSSVQINAISSSYVGSGITRRSSTDLTASGATVTVPAGYYSSQATKSVASGTEGTPTATKGTISNHAVTVTPSVTNTAGYIAGGTHSGTGVSVSASELVSGTLNVTSSGTKDVTNYASASIPAGTVTAPSSISGTSATVSTGTNTLTLTKTVSVTPNVSTAGYVSSGTAGNSSISLQASVTTKAAATIHPSTSDQTIASGTYTTGAQTIKAVTTSNLTAENIKSGVVVQIGDSTDSDCVTSVTGTYTGGSSKALYKYEGLASRTANSYGSTSATVTVTKAGTYNISYVAIRGSSSGTMGTNLHIGASSGTNNQTFNNGTYGQYATLTNQQIAANTAVTIYATSGSNSRTIYVGQLIVEEV